MKCLIQTINSIPAFVDFYKFDFTTDLADLFNDGQASFATSALLEQMKSLENYVDITEYKNTVFKNGDESSLKEKCPSELFTILLTKLAAELRPNGNFIKNHFRISPHQTSGNCRV